MPSTERISQADNLQSIRFKEKASVTTPPTDYVQVYFDAEGLLNWKNDAGTQYSFERPPVIGGVSDAIFERDGAASVVWNKAYENTSATATATLTFQRSRGTKAAPAAVANNDYLGNVSFRGYGTSFSGNRASIRAQAAEAWGAAAHGTKLVFQTTLNGTTTLDDALILHNDKRMEGRGERSFKDAAVVGFTGSDFVEKEAGVQTTDATVTDIATISLAQGQSVIVEGIIMALRSDFTEAIGGTFSGVFRRPTGGNVTLVGTVNTSVKEDSSGSPVFTLAADTGNQTVDIRVTGEAAKTFNWVVKYHYMRVATNA